MSDFDEFMDTTSSDPFLAADAFTRKHEGGFTRNDGIGYTANQGIDQNAHPNIDVSKLTSAQTQKIRRGYWDAVGGDELARKDPRLALIAYETAIASGPGTAKSLLAKAGDDPAQLMALRVNFMNGLVARDPDKYGAVAKGWENRNADLAQAAGLDPKAFGLAGTHAVQTNGIPAVTPAAKAASPFDAFMEATGPTVELPKPTVVTPPPMKPAEQLKNDPVPAPSWSWLKEMMGPLTLGHGDQAEAMQQATALHPKMLPSQFPVDEYTPPLEGQNNNPPEDVAAWRQDYQKLLPQVTDARHQYEHENPFSAASANIVGGLPAMLAGGELAGPVLGAAATLGRPAALAARFIGGTSGGGMVPALASRTASGALQGVAQDYATSPEGEADPKLAALGGAGAGLLFGGIGKDLAHAGINPAVRDAAKTYVEDTGNSLFGHQLTTDKGLAKAGKAAVSEADQIKQLGEYTKSVAKTFSGDLDMAHAGEEALTPAVLEQANKRIGNQFGLIASRTTIPDNVALQGGLNAIQRSASANILDQRERAMVAQAVANIRREMARNGGQIDGDMYQKMTKSSDSFVAQLTSNPNTRQAGRQIKNLLDSQLEAYAPQDLQGVMQATRTQWRNLKTAEDALNGATNGLIDPKRYAKVAQDAAESYGPPTRDVQVLASAGNGIAFPRPSDVGGVKGATSSGSALSKLSHGAGIVGVGTLLGEHALPMISHLSGAPVLQSGVIGSLAGVGTVGAAAAARNALRKRALASPAWARAMMYGGPALDPNLTTPLAVQAAKIPWGQNDENNR